MQSSQPLKQQKYILQQRLNDNEIKQLKSYQNIITQFVNKHVGKPITFLTSGGTSVPLQKNAVRFIQNLSTGLRGSKLAQIILQQDQPLIFFYRDKTFLPYQNGITINKALLSENQDYLNKLIKARQQLQSKKDNILLISFNSIYMYLNGILQIKKHLPQKSILIMCAAVSDFIPKNVATHKITTTEQIKLELQNSPKILGLMTSKDLLCVSFKLQTDLNKINQRMEFALNKYNVDMVIGNVLNNKNWVHIEYNQSRFLLKPPVQYQSNIEKKIWDTVFNASQELFYSK